MKTFLLILFSCFEVYAASCCVGGGTKSFIQLRNFEKYQLGLSFSYRDNYAKFTPYGTLADTKKNETLVTSLGAGISLRDDLDASLQVPYSSVENKTGLGDASIGLRYVLIDPLYLSDWYPKISLVSTVKAPTGNQDGENGNGLWEPSLGLTFEKDYTVFLINLTGAYTYRSHREGSDVFKNEMVDVKVGDKFELSESVIFPITEALSLATGSTQTWERATQLNSQYLEDTHGRSIQGFISSTYFLSRIWKMTVAFESTLPVEGWGTALQATRALTFTSTYSIY